MLNGLPIILIVANPFAIATDRQQSLKSFNLPQYRFEFRDTLVQFHLQPQGPLSHVQSRQQLPRIVWLKQIIVGAGSQATNFAFYGKLSGRSQDDVQRLFRKTCPRKPAKLIAVNARNLPIDQQDKWIVVAPQHLPGAVPVIDGNCLIIPLSDELG